MEADELELLDRTVRHALGSEADADDALEGIGWSDVLAAEPRDAVSVVFGALGDLHAVASALDDVMLDGLGVTAALGSAVALPAFGEWGPPGRLDGGTLAIDGLTLARARASRHHRGSRATESASSSRSCPPTRSRARSSTAWHPSSGWHVSTPTPRRRAPPRSSRPPRGTTCWSPGAGRWPPSSSPPGAPCWGSHASTRWRARQFGRPIAQFQAVRHRLAETYVALEAADAAVVSAWDVPDPMTAMLAKSLAGRGARVAATHCQQVLAGIGFTTEHPLHHFVKRVAVLDGLLGSSRRLPREVGASLLATRVLPALLEL